jgi:hypothetical protein
VNSTSAASQIPVVLITSLRSRLNSPSPSSNSLTCRSISPFSATAHPSVGLVSNVLAQTCVRILPRGCIDLHRWDLGLST